MTPCWLGIPALIARASLCTRGVGAGHTVSGHAQKAVLLAVWYTEGYPAKLARIASLAGTCEAVAWRALTMLVADKVVDCGGTRYAGGYSYTINATVLDSLATRHSRKEPGPSPM